MEFYLSYNNQEQGFLLPVNPAKIEISESGNGKTYTIAQLGEINVIKAPQLTEISFESEFPGQPYPYVVGDLREPSYYVGLINGWRATKRPIRFVLTGGAIDINMAVSIEKFNWEERAGEEGDISYSLSLKKYVFYAARKASVGKSLDQKPAIVQKSAPPRPNEKQPPKTYKLAPGENLWTVAKKTLGDGARAKEIQKLNGLTDAQLKSLPIGLTLKLPT